MEKTPSSMEEVELLNAERSAISTIQVHQNDPRDDNDNDDDLWFDDGATCNEFDKALDIASDLDREWQRRHDQYHAIGYRDGLTAGKEASAQEGFNDGFKKSVLVGYKWGLVRGVTSALAGFPNGLKEKLVGVLEKREKLQNLYESAHSVSTQDALNSFHVEVMARKSEEQYECLEGSPHAANVPYAFPSSSHLGRYIKEFESLDLDSTAIKLHSAVGRETLD